MKLHRSFAAQPFRSLIVLLAVILLSSAERLAKQVNGTLGSPNATITIDGKQLPAPPPAFGGEIKASSVAHARPECWFLGSKPSPRADGSGRERHSLEDDQAVLFVALKSSIAGRCNRRYPLCSRASLELDSPS